MTESQSAGSFTRHKVQGSQTGLTVLTAWLDGSEDNNLRDQPGVRTEGPRQEFSHGGEVGWTVTPGQETISQASERQISHIAPCQIHQINLSSILVLGPSQP